MVDADHDGTVPHKGKHPISCTDCGEPVRLVGLHMRSVTDGVIVACRCTSLDAVPYELGEAELPEPWEIDHETEVLRP